MPQYDCRFFEDLIPNCSCYFAHLPNENQVGRKPELLSEHSALVMLYARRMEVINNLEGIIERLIADAIPHGMVNKALLAEAIKKLFWQAIAFHDLGKLNHGFQFNRMKNHVDILRVKHSFENQHSVISVYLFLALFFQDFLAMEELTEEEQIFLTNVALYLSYPIFKHHSARIDKAQNETNWDNEDLFALKPFLTLFKHHLNDSDIEKYHNFFLANANFNFLFDRFNRNICTTENAFPLYALIKLNYSLLTASDYLATAHYMNDWVEMVTDFGLLTEDIQKNIIANAKILKSYNKEVYDAIGNNEPVNPDNYITQSNDNLNALRRCIAMEVVGNVRKNTGKRLFYIEAPTGGGKTNVSMLALAELLKTDQSIQKIFYVFPFTTLITQTYLSLVDTLGLMESEIAEIHSKAPIQKRTRERDINEDSDYKNYLDALFMNYPVTLLSHIRFFDVLKTNAKETNYLLHRFTNSVVIIDEIQSYSPKIWDKIVYFIVNYARYFNMRFIIMSATLPKIGDIIDRKELASDFVYLIADKNKYFQNPNFCNRVQFDYSLLEWDKPDKNNISNYLENLNIVVFEKSRDYAETNGKYPDSVFTIIEFIFKKTASDYYSISKATNEKINFFDEILLLSGTILEPRRRQIINKLKLGETRKKKILLVTTQVVEAGVDIDMDLGFKDKSIVDSEEQLAGRINRNVNKPACKLYIFDCNTEKTLYGGDDRYSLMKNIKDEYYEILEQKDFDRLYRIVIQKIKEKNHSEFIENIDDLFISMATLNFEEVDKSLKIIIQQNVSVFVPLEIDILLVGDKNIDTLNELEISYTDVLNGSEVWQRYSEMINGQNEDFVKSKILMKKFQSILSMFTFSIFPNGSDYELLKTYGEEKYGFLYLESFREIYSFESGINTDKLSNSNFI
ncbi:CRISPR-associated helicase cas3 [Proteiniphilum saccharofermentans]|uniref:CRISPR-associated helicase cas3 n=1 Tax=Proteiniphilum saccharofermentans TaxID=1642647 RepID=A0A1R3SWB2_9BACT|nr:CRISPR-associated helicase/endonuclease Cas3 [Proteiniphilum saccharofermentans]SCD20573.1 CRISPR-associated helicase cas3 [Proteiniphilum saccharofermentans]